MKEPKQWECIDCSFISSRCKSIKFPGISFAVCFKCQGRIKERQEWLDWLYESRDRQLREAKERNEGYILGIKVTDAEVQE